MNFIKFILLSVLKPIAKFLENNYRWRQIKFFSTPSSEILLANTVDGTFVVDPCDKTIAFHTYAAREAFEMDKFDIVYKLLPKNHSKKLLVDVGANIGTISIGAIKRGYFSKSIAIEPEPKNYNLLKANIHLNDLSKSIKAYKYALSNVENRNLNLKLSKNNYGDHRIYPSTGTINEKDVLVSSTTLDNILVSVEKNSCFIWIDTQGHEGFVLQGAKKIISESVPICFEFWPYMLKEFEGFELLKKSFKSANYKKVIDLEYPDQIHNFDQDFFNFVFNRLGNGKNKSFTDILVF